RHDRRRLAAVSQPDGRLAAVRRHLLRHHRPAPAARGLRFDRHRGHRAGIPTGAVRRRPRRDDRSVLAFRRSRVDVRLPARVPDECALRTDDRHRPATPPDHETVRSRVDRLDPHCGTGGAPDLRAPAGWNAAGLSARPRARRGGAGGDVFHAPEIRAAGAVLEPHSLPALRARADGPFLAGRAASHAAAAARTVAADGPGVSMGALLSGMLILMVAAFLLVTGIAVMAYRRRKRGAGD